MQLHIGTSQDSNTTLSSLLATYSVVLLNSLYSKTSSTDCTNQVAEFEVFKTAELQKNYYCVFCSNQGGCDSPNLEGKLLKGVIIHLNPLYIHKYIINTFILLYLMYK